VRSAFCAELGLADPGISWLTSRDRLAELASVLAMVCGTLARIGTEVYELQRPEIGELREPTSSDAVGSITMPHKRNPERSEHLDTLARLVRANAGVLLEGMVAAHERDGRSWKAEWVAFPEVCLLTGVALETAKALLSGLEVDVDAMAANLGDSAGSERLLATLTARLGKHEAQARLHEAIQPGADRPASLQAAAAGLFPGEEIGALLSMPAIEGAQGMVDEVVARARAARLAEPDQWA
jgi:adenylosuccinate lyase